MGIAWIILGTVVMLFLLTVFRGAPYVPTRKSDLERAFTKLCPIGSDDFIVDIGAGDGIVLRQAALRGARGLGLELNPVLVGVATILNWRQRGKIRVKLADFWYTQLPSETTLVYAFGESRDIKKMYQKIEHEATRLGKPLLFMSYGFAVADAAPIKHDKSFYLYRILPLLEAKPQV